MAQPTDVVLDSAGYMIAPGKYTRGQDGAAEGRTGRISFRDFFGGQRRHMQLERDKGFGGTGVGPALNGQGVQPQGTISNTLTGPAFPTMPSANTRIPYAWVRDALYFAIGSKLYRQPSTASIPIEVHDFTSPVKDLCIYAEDGLLATHGAAKDVTFYSTTLDAEQAIKIGEKGHYVAAYAGFAVWSDARSTARPSYLIQVTGSGTDIRILDHPIIGFANVGAEVYAITKQAIYSYNGRVKDVMIPNPAYTGPGDTDDPSIRAHQWSGEWEPFFQQGVWAEADDYRVFEGYGGDILAWISGRMMRFKRTGERAGWLDTGLSGQTCLGGCVAGGVLVVSIISHEGQNELWQWDGSGWWRIATKAAAATGNWIWPMPLAGTGGSRDLIVFREGSVTLDYFRLVYRSATAHNYPTSADFVTSMIDASERDKDKAWRKIGAVFASPERTGNTASADAVQCSLQYSTDGGATWISAGLVTVTGNTLANQTFTIDTSISASSRFLMLRVRWTSVVDWAPVLTGLWAEFEMLDSPSRRRRWTFDVAASDQAINRDGQVLTRTGRQLIAELWSAWSSGTTLPFRDLDYDADPTERTVRIVGIAEKVPRPADQGKWGDSVVSLTLVEV